MTDSIILKIAKEAVDGDSESLQKLDGAAEAQYYQGWMHYHGTGVEQDYSQAMCCWLIAAEAGHASAQYNLGNMYESGKGGAYNLEQAAHWHQKAAEQGNAGAQYRLGVMYEVTEQLSLALSVKEIEKDDKKAVYWYRKAAEQDNTTAQINLGLVYAKSAGAAQNYSHAYFWLSVAATRGSERAIENLDRMIEHLSKEEILRVKVAVEKCVESDYKDFPASLEG